MDDNTEITAEKEIPLEFNGKSGEYFRIWIVNILLTIITLGIYAPWAKVRTKRYFYGNTVLENSPFDFIANPVTILKGYLLAVALYIVFSLTTEFYPSLSIVMILLFFAVLPWIVVRSMVFRLSNTTYKNIRFKFDKDYAGAYKVFVGIGLLVPLTLGLIFPYYHFRQSKFVVDKSGFGQSKFNFDAPVGDFYIIYIAVWLMFTGLGVLMVIAMPLLLVYFPELSGVEQAVADGAETNPEQQKAATLFSFVLMAGVSFFYLIIFAYLQTAISNLLWNNITIAKQRFRSSLKTSMMIWLYLSNAIGIIGSFGLLIPWARIRLTRYRIEQLVVLSETDLGEFMEAEHGRTNAAGEEIGEVFGMDIGL